MSSPSMSEQFDKLASVAIQGGGVYGLTLLGQLQAVVEQGYRIVALSGTSAGAIVATLYWAGVPLDVVRDTFKKLAGPPNRVTDLLGDLSTDRRRMPASVVNRLLRTFRRVRASWGGGWPARAVALLTGGTELVWLRASSWADGGLFPGGEFEQLVDQLIRRSPRVASHVASGRLPPTGLLTFGDLWGLTEEALAYFPALTLTAANLTTGGLELIDSTDPRFHRIPIATAVRASGGFPGFFTPVPVELTDQNGSARRCRLVDGGVICNFPAFVFSRWARVGQLGEHERFRPDVMRPWVNIGLRLGDPPPVREVSDLPSVVGRVGGLLTGGGRTILESRLAADTVERYTPCEQPFAETGWPTEYGLLGFDRLTPGLVDGMWEAGKAFATGQLAPLAFHLPPADEVEEWMAGLVDAVATTFGDPGNKRWGVRATLFVPQGDQLVLHYRANMNSPADTDRVMNLEPGEGLVGYCYDRRNPLVCNLTAFAQAQGMDPLPFWLSPEAQASVRRDRSWLLSVPVFDPKTASPDRFFVDPSPPEGSGVFTEPESPLDGALFGVLSVDAGFDYAALNLDPDPEFQMSDSRWKLAYDTMLSTSWSIGKVFDIWFARRPPGSTP